MSVRQETHLPDKSADRDNTTLAERAYQATYPWCGIVREDIISTHQDNHALGSHLNKKYRDTQDIKIHDRENSIGRYQVIRSPDSDLKDG